jgi:AcrR family transcriptional regulator
VMKAERSDLRTKRTRARLLAAFSGLALEHPYESITVRRIVTRAHVSRSTFYEHFAGKDGLLERSLSGLFGVLADAAVSGDVSRLPFVLEHFRENAALARELLGGLPSHTVSGMLVRQIETRLKANCRGRRAPLLLPLRLSATQLAGIILTTLVAWVRGESRCDSARLARGLGRTCGAALESLYAGRR